MYVFFSDLGMGGVKETSIPTLSSGRLRTSRYLKNRTLYVPLIT